MAEKPTVLFICNTNGGKSQMAAGLAELDAADNFTAISAGVKAGSKINAESAASLAKIGARMGSEVPTQLTREMLQKADRVIVVGGADVPDADGVVLERWKPIEPSEQGIEGEERMDMLRDDIRAKVQALAEEF